MEKVLAILIKLQPSLNQSWIPLSKKIYFELYHIIFLSSSTLCIKKCLLQNFIKSTYAQKMGDFDI